MQSTTKEEAELKHQKNSARKPAHPTEQRRAQAGPNRSWIFETGEDQFYREAESQCFISNVTTHYN